MRASLKDKESINLLLEGLSHSELSSEVLNSLVSLNSPIFSEAKQVAIGKLKNADPLFVLTGQQVGLFGGPLLTFYKAVTAIRAAKDLSNSLNRDVLPVFWLQSEDQDLLEISTSTFFTATGELKNISLDKNSAKLNRKSVGKVSLNQEVLDAVKSLDKELEILPQAIPLLESMHSAYSQGNTWSSAFLSLFANIFKDTELLFFDLNSSNLKSSPIFKRVITNSIIEMSPIEDILTKSTKESNLEEGVLVKENSPLCFIDDKDGNRFRLVCGEDGMFTASGAKQLVFSKSQLIEILENEPERFSTSALLRPIVQDSFFPTLAYVGGDAELKYHRQLDNLYPHFGITPPLLLARSKFRLLSKKTNQIVKDLELELDSYALSNEQLGDLLRKQGKSFGIDSADYLSQVDQTINGLVSKFHGIVNEIDPTLEEPLKKTSLTAINAFTQFVSRLSKASILRDSVTLNRIEKVRSMIFPFGKEQERELSTFSVIARTGPNFLNQIQELSGKFDGAVQTLVIEEL